MSFGNLSAADGLAKLNTHLESRSYIQGYAASAEDVKIYQQVSNGVDAGKFAHVARWLNHIAFLVATNRVPKGAAAATPAPAAAAAPKAAAPAAAAKKADDDDDNAFSLDDDEDDAATLAAIAAKKKAADDAKKKAEEAKKKELPVAKSSIVWEIKPMEAETDLGEVEKAVRLIVMEGLHWGGADRVPVAFGVFKLRMVCTIVDDLVSADELQENIEAIDGVQSVDIMAFNKC